MTEKVRTRFAPSPTGYMHVGNLRTALYAYLCARHAEGEYVLRIEDTDQKRYVADAVDVIYRTLSGAGIQWDEGPDKGGDYGPYVQSRRKAIYAQYAQALVQSGNAYYCFCEKHDEKEKSSYADADDPCRNLSQDLIAQYINEGKPYVIRQRIPKDGITTYEDLVYGTITVENRFLDDQILMKRDGMPTYNFANVVDDHLMGITHVIRGADFLSSTPKYQLLYQAFQWESPQYAHLPLIMGQNEDGSCSKLSKRHGATSFEQLVTEGYLPEAIVNYIALLGWSPKTQGEILSLDEMIALFDIGDVNCAQAIFDYKKLAWMNGLYIGKLTDDDFCRLAYPYIAHLSERIIDHWSFIGAFLKTRVSTLKESADKVVFIDMLPSYSTDLFVNKRNKVTLELSEQLIRDCIDVFSDVIEADWNVMKLTEGIETYCEQSGVKKGAVMWPLRIALAGQPVTPMGTPEIMFVLGKAESLKRMKAGLLKLEEDSHNLH